VPHLVAAPDKFRGTATAPEIAQGAATGARRAGWTASCVPLADGGEGTLDAVGGEVRTDVVTGPLGRPVEAQWRLVRAGSPPVATAVVEMSRASGLVLAGGAARNDPIGATTRGTGELVRAALRAGADRVVVGCGGSATTDGGAGALEALAGDPALRGVELLVATDVTTPFLDAARVFAPQKGASAEQVALLTERLAATARARPAASRAGSQRSEVASSRASSSSRSSSASTSSSLARTSWSPARAASTRPRSRARS